MTLLTTEIHSASTGEMMVFAADQRISRGPVAAGTRPKIFLLPHHHAGLGYFGLAEVDTGTRLQPLSEWLQDLFPTFRPGHSLRSIAERLVHELNHVLPPHVRAREPLGLHLAGFCPEGPAEFWYIRNLDDDGRIALPEFAAREDYNSRDRRNLPAGAAAIYRNGDTRAHVAAWASMDATLGALLGQQAIRGLRSPDDYVDWVKFKMETIARFYERFATESIIGLPIDCFAFARPKNDA